MIFHHSISEGRHFLEGPRSFEYHVVHHPRGEARVDLLQYRSVFASPPDDLPFFISLRDNLVWALRQLWNRWFPKPQ